VAPGRTAAAEVATLLRRAVVEVLGHPYPGDCLDRPPRNSPAVIRPAQRSSVRTNGFGSPKPPDPRSSNDGQPGPATRTGPGSRRRP
jgi:hypothetical protein